MLLAPVLKRAAARRRRPARRRARGRLGDRLERVEVAGPGFLNLVPRPTRGSSPRCAACSDAGDGFGGGRRAGRRADRRRVRLGQPDRADARRPRPQRRLRRRAVARILAFHGHDVTREFYVNDYGSQVRRFAESIRRGRAARRSPEDGYQGDYVTELRRPIDDAASSSSTSSAGAASSACSSTCGRRSRASRVDFDLWFSERVAARGRPEPGRPHAFDRRSREARAHVPPDGALWLRTTDLRRRQGPGARSRSTASTPTSPPTSPTTQDKRERGFDRLSTCWGADHHGYVARMKAASQALGGDPDALELLIMQFVHLVDGGERASMCKRARRVRHARRPRRRDRRGRRPLVPARSARTTRRSTSTSTLAKRESRREPGLLRPVRARADRIDAGKAGETRRRGAAGAGGRRCRWTRPSGRWSRSCWPSPARCRGGRAPRAAPDRRLRARARAGVHRVLPRLPRRRRQPEELESFRLALCVARSARSPGRSTCSGSARRSRCRPRLDAALELAVVAAEAALEDPAQERLGQAQRAVDGSLGDVVEAGAAGAAWARGGGARRRGSGRRAGAGRRRGSGSRRSTAMVEVMSRRRGRR